MRDLVSKAIAILCNTHFEFSIKRRMSLKPHIDRKFHQMCNRKAKIGVNLFGDDIGKRLKDINEINKINKNITGNSKHFRFFRGRPFNRPYSRRGNSYGSFSQCRSYERRKHHKLWSKQEKVLKVSSLTRKHIKCYKTPGKLKICISKWKKITRDSWVLSTIMVYQIEFDSKPYQQHIPAS